MFIVHLYFKWSIWLLACSLCKYLPPPSSPFLFLTWSVSFSFIFSHPCATQTLEEQYFRIFLFFRGLHCLSGACAVRGEHLKWDNNNIALFLLHKFWMHKANKMYLVFKCYWRTFSLIFTLFSWLHVQKPSIKCAIEVKPQNMLFWSAETHCIIYEWKTVSMYMCSSAHNLIPYKCICKEHSKTNAQHIHKHSTKDAKPSSLQFALKDEQIRDCTPFYWRASLPL